MLFPTLFGWHNVVAWQSQSESPWLAVVVVGTLGNVIGSQLAYALGRWGRSGLFAPGGHGWHATALARSQLWFDRYGRASVFFGVCCHSCARSSRCQPVASRGCSHSRCSATRSDKTGSSGKDHLSYVDYAVVAIAISVFIAWLVSRGRRDARGQGSTADT